MMMHEGSTLYKDFSKEVTDLVNKNYSKAGSWKLESKYKGPTNCVYVNPQCDNGRMSADVEYNVAECGAKVKLNVTPAADLKLTTSYEEKGHKVEAIIASNKSYEVSHTGVINGVAKVNEKLTQDVVELGLSFAVARNCQFGIGSTYLMKGSDCQWTVGCRYAEAGHIISVTTARFNVFNTGILVSLPTQYPIKVAMNSVCTRGQGWDATFGVEAGCYLVKGNKSRVRITKSGEWCVGYIAKLADRWTAAITLNKDMKAGLILTHE